MSGLLKHYNEGQLILLFAASKDGKLPADVEAHIAECPDCMDQFIAAVNRRVGLPPVAVKPGSGRPNRPAEHVYGESARECWPPVPPLLDACEPHGSDDVTVVVEHPKPSSDRSRFGGNALVIGTAVAVLVFIIAFLGSWAFRWW